MNTELRKAYTFFMTHDFIQAVNIASGLGSTVGSQDYWVMFKSDGTYELFWSYGVNMPVVKEGIYLKVPQLTPPNLTSSDYLQIRLKFDTDFENLVKHFN